MALLHLKPLSILAAFAVIAGVNATWDILNLHYEPQNPQDPENVSLIRQALTVLGIDPNGIELIEFYQKWWVLGYSYRVTYIDIDGRKCFFHFRWKKMHGLRVNEVPRCEDGCDNCGPTSTQGPGICQRKQKGGDTSIEETTMPAEEDTEIDISKSE